MKKTHPCLVKFQVNLGVRLHVGPHYPRSSVTRESCLNGYLAFANHYPELIVSHAYSVYAIGTKDAEGSPSKVTVEQFVAVCKESSKCEILEDPSKEGYNNLEVIVRLSEPSVLVGKGLHDYFVEKLTDVGVQIVYGCNVESVDKTKNGISIKIAGGEVKPFDWAVNATSYHSKLLSVQRPLKLPFDVVYQPCLALVYKDLQPTSAKPFSFIVMDGWFPCLMPIVKYGDKKNPEKKYMLTHGKYTIMGSFNDVDGAKECLGKVDSAFIKDQIQPNCEKEMNRFWPMFKDRFKYLCWTGAVLAKTRSDTEFRSAVTYQNNDFNMINVIPGKVSNVFDAADEVKELIGGCNVIRDKDGFSYVRDGTLASGTFRVCKKK